MGPVSFEICWTERWVLQALSIRRKFWEISHGKTFLQISNLFDSFEPTETSSLSFHSELISGKIWSSVNKTSILWLVYEAAISRQFCLILVRCIIDWTVLCLLQHSIKKVVQSLFHSHISIECDGCSSPQLPACVALIWRICYLLHLVLISVWSVACVAIMILIVGSLVLVIRKVRKVEEITLIAAGNFCQFCVRSFRHKRRIKLQTIKITWPNFDLNYIWCQVGSKLPNTA